MEAKQKPAGRKKKYGGSYTIQRAKLLFEQSCEEKKPDYRYVALAIGSSPGAPPDWAIWACIEARQTEERSAARGIDADIPAILDDIVRFYDRKQREFELQTQGTPDALDAYVVPPLQTAIKSVLEDAGLRRSRYSKVDGDWLRDIRNAWDWEQDHDPPSDTSDWTRLRGQMRKRDGTTAPIKATSRIYRVLMETMARENGDPEDVNTWAWMAKRAVEVRNIRKQDIAAFGADEPPSNRK